MFQPPPPSEKEIKAQEEAASLQLKVAFSTCALLYLSPFAIDYASTFLGNFL